MSIMVGADPELFIKKGKSLVSAIYLIAGTKEEPLKTAHGAIQWDNVLGEYNIAPASTAQQFAQNNLNVLQDMRDHLGSKYQLDFSAAYWVPKRLLADIRTQVAGCTPDFNAWLNGQQNDPPDYRLTRLRSAGGHIHVSVPGIEVDYLQRLNVVKMMDIFVGLPGVIFGDDTDTLRRQVYGKAGAFRPKYINKGDPYNGIEYRASSNWWLRKAQYMEFVFSATEFAVKAAKRADILAQATAHSTTIINAINTGDNMVAASLNEYFINLLRK